MAGIQGIGGGANMGFGPGGIQGLGPQGVLGAQGQNPLEAIKQIPGMEDLIKTLIQALQQGQQQPQDAKGAQQGGGAPAGGAQGGAPAGGARGAEGGGSAEDIISQILKKLQENPELAKQILGALPQQVQQALGAQLNTGGRPAAATPAALGGVTAGRR